MNNRRTTVCRLRSARFVCAIGALAAAIMASGAFAQSTDETALDRYIAKPDDSYRWAVAATIPGEGYTGYVLGLTSQTWRTERDVDRPEWTHWLTVAVPDTITANTAMLIIGGGRNGTEVPEEVPGRLVDYARASGTIIAELGQVPNQPLHFADSRNHGRSEDDLIAYSRVKYIVTGDAEWLVRLAMVKSGVRAMDAIQEFAASSEGGGTRIEDFVVTGGSKRAWTTWLIAAVDTRVSAIIPVVIDALNTEAITRHHFGAYGFFSTALGDYVRHGLYPGLLGTPVFDEIMDIEDPYRYLHRERLHIPKYIINASGDQFFLPDNSQFYFADVPEEKHLRYVPNARHNLAGSDARETMLAYYEALLKGVKRPTFSWTLEKDGPIRVTVVDTPDAVHLWQAANPEARDFRLDTIGAVWTSTLIEAQPGGVYTAEIEKPAEGFAAFFVELVYDLGLSHPLKFTTDVSVIPDIEPYSLEGVTEILLK